MASHPGFKQRMVQFSAILTGTALVSVGLEMFLTPHKIIPGGIKGIAIILSHATEMKMGLFLLFINLPFVIFKKRNLTQTFSALFALLAIAILTVFLHPFPPLFQKPLLASICGGITLGLGIGLVVCFGWYSDGVADVALYLKKKSKLSIGELIMVINIVILGCGGFLFGWDQAIHSIIAYFLTYKTIQFALDYKSKKMIWVHSDKHEELLQLFVQEFQHDIEFLHQASGLGRQNVSDMFFILSGKHIKKLKTIVQSVDPSAHVAVSHANRSQTEPYYKI